MMLISTKTMSKTAVFSDSHGDTKSLVKACEFAITNNIDTIIHLGDDINDTDYISDYPVNLYVVPGTRDPGYEDIEKRNLNIPCHGHIISASHVKTDRNPDANIVIFGHTHIPEMKFENNKLYLNPGHIINNSKRYPISTFLIMDISPLQANVTFYSIDFQKLDEKVFLF